MTSHRRDSHHVDTETDCDTNDIFGENRAVSGGNKIGSGTQQKAEYAPTQVYIIPQQSTVSQRLLDLVNTGMYELDKFYDVTSVEELEKIAQAYKESKLKAIGLATQTQVASVGIPGPHGYSAAPQAGQYPGMLVAPAAPPGMPSAPAPMNYAPTAMGGGMPPAPAPITQPAVPAAGQGAAPAAPNSAAGVNPYKGLITQNDPRLQQGIPIPDCFSRVDDTDPDCQRCPYRPDCTHIKKQLAEGKQATLADFQSSAGTSSTPPPVAAQSTPRNAPWPATAPPTAAPVAPTAPAAPAGAVPAAALDALESSLQQGQNQQPPTAPQPQ